MVSNSSGISFRCFLMSVLGCCWEWLDIMDFALGQEDALDQCFQTLQISCLEDSRGLPYEMNGWLGFEFVFLEMSKQNPDYTCISVNRSKQR